MGMDPEKFREQQRIQSERIKHSQELNSQFDKIIFNKPPDPSQLWANVISGNLRDGIKFRVDTDESIFTINLSYYYSQDNFLRRSLDITEYEQGCDIALSESVSHLVLATNPDSYGLKVFKDGHPVMDYANDHFAEAQEFLKRLNGNQPIPTRRIVPQSNSRTTLL